MSNDQPDFDHAPELEPELNAAVWSVIQEPLDADAIRRVKARAKALADQDVSTATPTTKPAVRKARPTRAVPVAPIMQALAASIAVAVGGWLWFAPSNSAFAQVIEQLRAARTLTYVIETEHERFGEPIQQRVLVAADGRCRYEAGPLITIFDPSGNLRLYLNQSRKTAFIGHPPASSDTELTDAELDDVVNSLQASDLKWSDSELEELKKQWKSLGVELSDSEMDEVMKQLESGDYKFSETEMAEIKDEVKNTLESLDFDVSDLDWIEWLREHTGTPDRELGRQRINGRELDGFVVMLGDTEYTIWLDPTTEALAQIEYEVSVGGTGLARTVMKGFRFDIPLDDDLFSYEPPPGYRTEKVSSDVPPPSEESLVEALRGYTKLSGGAFPSSLANWGDWTDVLADPESEATKMLTVRLGAASAFLWQMATEDYAYLGDGKSVNGDRSVVFWYRNDAGVVRAVFTDLSVAEIRESELPSPLSPNSGREP